MVHNHGPITFPRPTVSPSHNLVMSHVTLFLCVRGDMEALGRRARPRAQTHDDSKTKKSIFIVTLHTALAHLVFYKEEAWIFPVNAAVTVACVVWDLHYLGKSDKSGTTWHLPAELSAVSLQQSQRSSECKQSRPSLGCWNQLTIGDKHAVSSAAERCSKRSAVISSQRLIQQYLITKAVISLKKRGLNIQIHRRDTGICEAQQRHHMFPLGH